MSRKRIVSYVMDGRIVSDVMDGHIVRDAKDERIIRAIDRILSGQSWDPCVEKTFSVVVDPTKGCMVDVTINGEYVLMMKKNKDTGTYHGKMLGRVYDMDAYCRLVILAREYGLPMPVYGVMYAGGKYILEF